jgi:hypothetical protein
MEPLDSTPSKENLNLLHLADISSLTGAICLSGDATRKAGFSRPDNGLGK